MQKQPLVENGVASISTGPDCRSIVCLATMGPKGTTPYILFASQVRESVTTELKKNAADGEHWCACAGGGASRDAFNAGRSVRAGRKRPARCREGSPGGRNKGDRGALEGPQRGGKGALERGGERAGREQTRCARRPARGRGAVIPRLDLRTLMPLSLASVTQKLTTAMTSGVGHAGGGRRPRACHCRR